MNFRKALRTLERSMRHSTPLVTVGISRENLLHNLTTYKERYPELAFAPVLKSNAYGHGLTIIAELLDKEDIAFFMLDSLFEARALRRAGIHSRIVIMGYVRPEEIASNRLPEIDFVIVDIEQLRELSQRTRRPIRIHVKIDTGMHRQGIVPHDLSEAIELIKSNVNLHIVGIASHFADADSQDQTYTNHQIEIWNAARKQFEGTFDTIQYKHISATKGAAHAKESGANVVRLGIGLYGFDTSPGGGASLKPVLEMRSIISSIREIPAGDFVGYNATFKATRPSKIATIPVGYFEGLDRALSNIGNVQIAGKTCNLVGRISMNMSSVDITDIPNVHRGDTVTIISRNPEDSNSVVHMAQLAGTIPYVILAHIPQHLLRVVE